MPVSKKARTDCPLDAAMQVVDGRWKGFILWRLVASPARLRDLRTSIPEAPERVLIRQLQELVADGIVDRLEDGGRPATVRYSISTYGLTLVPVLEAVCAWGRIHLERSGPVTGAVASATSAADF